MKTGEDYKEKDEGFELTFFNVDEDSGFNPGEDFSDDDEDSEKNPKNIDKEDVNDESSENNDDNDDSDNDDSEDNKDDNEENSLDPSETKVDKIMASLLEEGRLLLPDDYEYEPTEEGIRQAFEDSEKYRNHIAFQEALKFLTSKEGLDMIKIEKSVNKIESYENLDIEKLDINSKLDVIKDFYKAREYDDADIDDILEDLVNNELKLEKELNVASKFLKKEEQKKLQKEAETIADKKRQEEENYKNSQKILKEKLQTKSDYNGYVITEANASKIFNAIYKPIRLDDGNVTTEFNARLSNVLNDPDKILVLADLLVNMDEQKGFDFSRLIKKEETKAVEKVKKSIRDFKNSNTKSKVTGRNSQTQSDFDLSKASMSFF